MTGTKVNRIVTLLLIGFVLILGTDYTEVHALEGKVAAPAGADPIACCEIISLDVPSVLDRALDDLNEYRSLQMSDEYLRFIPKPPGSKELIGIGLFSGFRFYVEADLQSMGDDYPVDSGFGAQLWAFQIRLAGRFNFKRLSIAQDVPIRHPDQLGSHRVYTEVLYDPTVKGRLSIGGGIEIDDRNQLYPFGMASISVSF